METSSSRLRLSILGVVALSLFGALFARLWYLQVMAAPQYKVEAQANRLRTVTEEAPRGRILDAQGRVIVDNRTSRVVTVDPVGLKEVDDQDALMLRLAEALTSFGVPTKVSSIQQELGDPSNSPVQPIPIAIDVPEELQIYLAERADEFPSVDVTRESVRNYPSDDKTTLAHLLGYVGRISGAEYEARKGDDQPKPYQPDSPIGKGGIEGAYEDDLRGKPGIRKIEVDANNRPIRTVEYTPPEPGYDIQLTVDLDVQQTAERALREQLDAARGGRQTDTNGRSVIKKAPAGSVVILDPRNGGVRAMASYPTFNPEEFVNGISQARYDQLTLGAETDNPLINRALQGQYAPGSTFKPITAYAAMESGLIKATDTYNDTGEYDAGDRVFGSPGAKGRVNVTQSLTVSSDVYYYWIGHNFYRQRDRLGNAMQDTARSFGLGSPTGIPVTGEQSGLIIDPETKAELHEQNPDGFPYSDWFPGDDIQGAIGQNIILVTPLQLASVYATFANGGTVYQPQVVWRVLEPNSDPNDPASVVRTVEPVVKGQLPMPPEVRKPIVDGLVGVTNSSGGTAYATFRGFDQKNFQIAAKTGTAQVDGKADTSVFAMFAPVADPQYAGAAVLEESGFGADAAAPVMRRVLELLSGQQITNVGDIAVGKAD